MSKYKLGVFPQDQYRFRIFDNTAKLKDWPEIMTAAGPDCVAAMNLAYLDVYKRQMSSGPGTSGATLAG